MTRRIVAVVPDLFFSTRIVETAKTLGVVLELPATSLALERCRAATAGLIVLDLHGAGALGLARALKADPATRAIPIVGFQSHVDTALRQAALDAGIDHVLPRSAFSAKLAAILAGEWPVPRRNESEEAP